MYYFNNHLKTSHFFLKYKSVIKDSRPVGSFYINILLSEQQLYYIHYCDWLKDVYSIRPRIWKHVSLYSTRRYYYLTLANLSSTFILY